MFIGVLFGTDVSSSQYKGWGLYGGEPVFTDLVAEAWASRVLYGALDIGGRDLPSDDRHQTSIQRVMGQHHIFLCCAVLGTLTDLSRSKSELVAENALLRQQVIILRRQVKRPACTKTDRMLLVLLASMVRTWKQALFIVQPETLLRWHRQGFKLYWKYKSRAMSATPKISAETVALIQQMARDNRRLRSRTHPW